MDKVTLDRINQLHPKVREEVKAIYAEICAALSGRAICRFSATFRTFAEQAALFAQRPKVTQASAGKSFHNYGLAIDIVLLVDADGNGTYETASWDEKKDFDADGKSDWQEVVAIFKQHGWEWGGDWKFTDTPHFQKTFGKSVNELLEMYNAKKLIPSTNYVAF
jgi:peptidoglycan L-alanyl-D-glutamate endopeptidase CwlK